MWEEEWGLLPMPSTMDCWHSWNGLEHQKVFLLMPLLWENVAIEGLGVELVAINLSVVEAATLQAVLARPFLGHCLVMGFLSS